MACVRQRIEFADHSPADVVGNETLALQFDTPNDNAGAKLSTTHVITEVFLSYAR